MPQKTKDKTIILDSTEANIKLAATEIVAGGVVAFGTETVYGLGANLYSEKAVKKIYQVKGRPGDNPLIVHIESLLQLKDMVKAIPDTAYELAKNYMPGPLTIILKKTAAIPSEVTAGLDTVAIRMPGQKTALAFIKACGCPLAAPSANRSGFVSPTSAAHVLADLSGLIPYVLDTGTCRVGLESTVIDLTKPTPAILRQGAVTLEQINSVIGKTIVASGCTEGKPASPGMKYRHYAPKAQVFFSSYHANMYAFINIAYDEADKKGKTPIILCLEPRSHLYGMRRKHVAGKSLGDYARNLYTALRDIDADGFDCIIAEGVPPKGIGAAIVNRLMKASENNIL